MIVVTWPWTNSYDFRVVEKYAVYVFIIRPKGINKALSFFTVILRIGISDTLLQTILPKRPDVHTFSIAMPGMRVHVPAVDVAHIADTEWVGCGISDCK
ncbi:MAG: hypothetical protein WCC64_05360 [Aliidongia sp.]